MKKTTLFTLVIFLGCTFFTINSRAEEENEKIPPLHPIIPDTSGQFIEVGKKALVVESEWIVDETLTPGKKSVCNSNFRTTFHQEFGAELVVYRTPGYNLARGEFLRIEQLKSEVGELMIDSYSGDIVCYDREGTVSEKFQITTAWESTNSRSAAGFEVDGVMGTGIFRHESYFEIAGKTGHIMLSHPELWSREVTIGEAEGGFKVKIDIAKLWRNCYISVPIKDDYKDKDGHGKTRGTLHIYLSKYGEDLPLLRVKIFNRREKK